MVYGRLAKQFKKRNQFSWFLTTWRLTVNNNSSSKPTDQQTNEQTRKKNLLATPLVIRIAGAVGKIMKNKLINK